MLKKPHEGIIPVEDNLADRIKSYEERRKANPEPQLITFIVTATMVPKCLGTSTIEVEALMSRQAVGIFLRALDLADDAELDISVRRKILGKREG